MNCNCGFPSTHTHTHTHVLIRQCFSHVQMIDSYKLPQSSVVMILNPKKPAWDLNLLYTLGLMSAWVLLVSWIHTCYVHLCISAAISHAGASECYGLCCWKPDGAHKGRFNYAKVYHPNFQAPTHLYSVTSYFCNTQLPITYCNSTQCRLRSWCSYCGFYFCCSASSWVPPEWHCWADAEHDEATTPRAGHMHGEGGWSWESFTIRVLRVSWRFDWVYITTFMC